MFIIRLFLGKEVPNSDDDDEDHTREEEKYIHTTSHSTLAHVLQLTTLHDILLHFLLLAY